MLKSAGLEHAEVSQKITGTQNALKSLIANNKTVLTRQADRERVSPSAIKKSVAGGKIDVEIDELTPCLRRLSDNKIVDTHFEIIDPRKMDLRDWEFAGDWAEVKRKGYTIKGLFAENDTRVQGLVAYKDAPKDTGVYVALVESAPQNNSHNNIIEGKEYDGVGGHLFAEAVKESYHLGYNGFVAFKAKTVLTKYYSKELGAFQIGRSQRMIIDEVSARRLYERYYGNK